MVPPELHFFMAAVEFLAKVELCLKDVIVGSAVVKEIGAKFIVNSF